MKKIHRSQIAIGNYHYVSWSLDYFLHSVKRIGIGNIEIWGAKPHLTVDGHSMAQKRDIAKKIHDLGLQVVCFCPEQNSYPIDISTTDKEFRNYSIEHMKRAIETANVLGAGKMLLCPGNGYLEEPIQTVRDRFIESVNELLPTCVENGVVLVLETQDQADSIFMNTVLQQKEVLELLPHPFFKSMLDTIQLGQFDNSVTESMRILGTENVRHVHLGNTILKEKTCGEKMAAPQWRLGRDVCGHIGFREGNLPLLKDLEELASSGYKDYITIEICQRPYYFEAERYAREAFECIMPIIDEGEVEV